MNTRWFGLLVAVSLLAGCVSPKPPAGSEARTVNFTPGTPQYDAEARVVREGDGFAIDVDWGIYPISLIWTSPFGDTHSIVESRVTVRSEESGLVVASHMERDTLRVQTPEQARSYEYDVRSVRLPVDAGDYLIEIDISDRITGRSRVRSIPAAVPHYEGTTRLSSIQLFEAEEDTRILSLHVPSGLESLLARATLLGSPPEEVTARLIWIQSDTTIADPPYFLNKTRGAVQVRGVQAETSEVLVERTWQAPQPGVDLDFDFPVPRQGLYRIEIETDDSRVQRDFVVRHESFPVIDRLDVMAEALSYITTNREYRDLMAVIEDPIELKSRFDAFWLDVADDERAARRMIEVYYGRVEEANRRFTGVKEGWKSDRGMVYIIRGAPLFVERSPNHEVWFYSYTQAEPADVFAFERMPMFEFEGQFEQYVLQRGPAYDYEWRRIIDRWRAGRIP
jgi:GWxTD domain-containing protein